MSSVPPPHHAPDPRADHTSPGRPPVIDQRQPPPDGLRGAFAGVGYLFRGQRWVFGHGRWFGFGLLPALVTLVLYVAVLVALAFWADDVAVWATPFADGWASPWPGLVRGTFAVLLWLAVLLLAALTFTAVALLVGDPFYEKLSEHVERSAGHCPEGEDRPLWRELWGSLRDSCYVLYRAARWSLLFFVLGFLPFVGQTVIPVLAFAVSGFFLTLELTSVALERRGIAVRERLRLLRRFRGAAVGFGAPLALAFLLPVIAVVLMPGAVAGATLLVRDVAGDAARDGAARDDAAPGAPRTGPLAK